MKSFLHVPDGHERNRSYRLRRMGWLYFQKITKKKQSHQMQFHLGDVRIYEHFTQNAALYLDSGLGEGVSATRLNISGVNH